MSLARKTTVLARYRSERNGKPSAGGLRSSIPRCVATGGGVSLDGPKNAPRNESGCIRFYAAMVLQIKVVPCRGVALILSSERLRFRVGIFPDWTVCDLYSAGNAADI